LENKVLRRIFGPKRDEVTGEWKMLHNDGIYVLVFPTKYYLGDQIKKKDMGGECGRMGDKRVACRV
jgi:hypothetical protein